MRATIVNLTPELAKDYLKRNNENRKVKKTTLDFYKTQMNSGKWKENGEPIIIDENGVIKDGQHRLLAVLESGHSYRVPVISEIQSDVMDTIDTGHNRTASDVLYLEGFKYASLMASSIKLILLKRLAYDGSKKVRISNSDILEFAQKKKSYLLELINQAQKISSLQIVRVLTDTQIVYYLDKYGNNKTTINFLENIVGIKRKPKSATDYVYKKLYLSYSGDERLSLGDKQKYIEKAYDYFVLGNKKVNSIKIKYKKK